MFFGASKAPPPTDRFFKPTDTPKFESPSRLPILHFAFCILHFKFPLERSPAMTSKAPRLLPTLSLLLSITPTVLMLILVALSARGNWGFLILGGITYLVSQLVCGIASLILGILCIRKRWGRGRAVTALILSSLGLAITLELIGTFLLQGLH